MSETNEAPQLQRNITHYRCYVHEFDVGPVTSEGAPTGLIALTAKFPGGKAELLFSANAVPGLVEALALAGAATEDSGIIVAKDQIIVPGEGDNHAAA